MYIPPKPKSRFITGLSISLIIISAKVVFISGIFMFNITMHDAYNPDMTSETDEVFSYMRWGFGVNVLLAACFISGAIGLFHRKNWARILVMGLFVFLIGAMLCGIAAEWIWMGNDGGLIALKIFSILFAGGITALLCWLVKKLNEEAIVIEFMESGKDSSPNDFSL